VEKARNEKRQRVLSTQELTLLKQACFARNDTDLWDIIKMALKSLLRTSDLIGLELGNIDIVQNKTQHPIKLPVTLLKPLNYVNFRKRWEAARRDANLVDVQFRDLRKTSANLMKNRNWSNKIISEALGHTNTQTTEIYMVKDVSHLKKPLEELANIVDSL
jgi:integrase